jgi:heptosyltransferase-2
LKIKYDCKFFPGDRPCKPHKETGVICDNCSLYSSVKFKILIIKLDAIGDVLRTTSLLPALKKKYTNSHITWLTKNNASALFINNTLVDEILILEDSSMISRLSIEKFNVVINLDPSKQSSALATFANADTKYGFTINESGKVFPVNASANEWFEMGAFDYLKKSNKKTYQQIISEICGLKYNKDEIIFKLSDMEKQFAEEFKIQHNLGKYDVIIGINPGASDRWQFKKWRLDGYTELVEKLLDNYNCAVLLYGSSDEIEINGKLNSISQKVFDTGSDNSLREFAALINLSDILITGDTLGLHIATALKKKVVCIFGPTSHNEIEDYGIILKIKPDMDCLVCYKNSCNFVPNCMENVTADMVYNTISELIITEK